MKDRRTTIVCCDTLARNLDDPRWAVFDCRFALQDPDAGRQAYLREHIPTARYVHLDHDLSSPATPDSGRHPLPQPDELIAKLRDWGVNRNSQIAVYDDSSGAIAGRLWWLLRYLGHTDVAVLNGGFKQWQAENKPLESGAGKPAPAGDFGGEAHDDMWVTTAELERTYQNEDTVVIDARNAERYSGEQENVDNEGGHIPGSLNHPLQTNLDEHGCFLPAEKLREMYAPLRKSRTIHSCGSGVTACHNLLAMEIAGFTGTQLYVGSWSEWIRSPQRPRARGKQPG